MVELVNVPLGQTVVVKEIRGDKRFLSRVTSIGLGIGSRLKVLNNEKRRPLLVYGRNTTIAINRKECKKIVVEEVTI
ncbi:MAG: FeoA family protein [Lachnospiraceae bacterium]